MSKEEISRFSITTNDGDSVRVTCEWDSFSTGHHHFEFHGSISTTGYRSHFFHGEGEDVAEFATSLANAWEVELHKRDTKLRRCKRKVGDFLVGEAVRISSQNGQENRRGIVAGYDYPYSVAVQIPGEKWLQCFRPEELASDKGVAITQCSLF